jgi:hypothetical protein
MITSTVEKGAGKQPQHTVVPPSIGSPTKEKLSAPRGGFQATEFPQETETLTRLQRKSCPDILEVIGLQLQGLHRAVCSPMGPVLECASY